MAVMYVVRKHVCTLLHCAPKHKELLFHNGFLLAVWDYFQLTYSITADALTSGLPSKLLESSTF